jgi:putative ABC transport system substrate-binding protein
MASHIERREFLAALGSAAAWPLAARAQQAGKLPTIAVLGADPAVWASWTAAFEARLGQLGWLQGRTVTIEYRWAEGRATGDAEIAAEFVRQKVDVILTYATAALAVKRATSVIPVVFVLASDPIGAGLVTTLGRPDGNVTGLSQQAADLASKRVELLREVIPQLHQLVIIGNPGYSDTKREIDEVQSVARTLGLEIAPLEVRRPDDIAIAFETMKGGADALYVVGDPLTAANRTRIITFALSMRLPMIFNTREHVQAGGLMSYGPNFPDQFRRAADYVDKILRGSKPADIPVEQPTKFDLVINLTTAKALRLKIPESFLLRADEVIE